MFLLCFPIYVPAVTWRVAFSETKVDGLQHALLIQGPIKQYRCLRLDISMRLQWFHPVSHLARRHVRVPARAEWAGWVHSAVIPGFCGDRKPCLALRGRTETCEEWAWRRLAPLLQNQQLPDGKHDLWCSSMVPILCSRHFGFYWSSTKLWLFNYLVIFFLLDTGT